MRQKWRAECISRLIDPNTYQFAFVQFLVIIKDWHRTFWIFLHFNNGLHSARCKIATMKFQHAPYISQIMVKLVCFVMVKYFCGILRSPGCQILTYCVYFGGFFSFFLLVFLLPLRSAVDESAEILNRSKLFFCWRIFP